MKSLLQTVILPAAALGLTLFGGAVMAQAVAQTPLAAPLQVSGTVTPSQPSSCGVVATSAAQVLQVNEDFAAVNIATTGSQGLTLLIQGPNGFSECHTTSDAAGTINAPGLLNRGSYSFIVGNASATPTSYTLTISQN